MIIRLANSTDCTPIASVFKKAFGPFKEKYTPDAYASTAVKEPEIEQRMKEGFTWIAVESDTVLGTVTVTPTWEGLYVTGMAVSPDAQGKKLGWKLLSQLESHARQENFDRIYLYTTFFLHRAIHLYEKFGFTRYGKPGEKFMGTYLIQFEKYL